jgi:hypothetical protein
MRSSRTGKMRKTILALCAELACASAAIAQCIPLGPGCGGTGGSSVPFVATGGSTATSPADRATYNGVRLDMRADFGAACDGATNDAVAIAGMITKVNILAATNSVTVTVPGTCIDAVSTHTITGAVSFEGINGGGFQLPSGRTLTGDWFHWAVGSSRISVKSVTFDLNSAQISTGGAGALYFSTGHPVFVDHSNIINGGQVSSGARLFLIEAYGIPSGVFSSNLLTFSASQAVTPSPQNQCINIGAQGSTPTNDVDVIDNTCVNTGIFMGNLLGDRFHLDRNTIDGFSYGAGISAEVVGTNDGAIKSLTYIGNIIRNSNVSVDATGDYVDGIENGYSGALISGNRISSTCGPGITSYGAANITDNFVLDAGTCNHSAFLNSGIVLQAPGGSTNSGSGSSVNGNIVTDDGGGHTSYGFSDVAAITAANLGTNNFKGSLGAYNITGGTTHSAPSADNRIVNPCFQFDQTNAGANIVSGKSADQWNVAESHGYVSVFAGAATGMGQCAFGLTASIATQYTPLAADAFNVNQNIALADIKDIAYGTSLAKDAVFAFCVKTNLSPPFIGAAVLQNNNAAKSIGFNYTISAAANTRQCFSFPVPADTAGAIGTTQTAAVFKAIFDLGAGSTGANISSLGVWGSGASFGTTTATPFVSEPVGSTITFSSVRLMVVQSDNGWQPPTAAQAFANVQRFKWTTEPAGTKPAAALGLNTGEIQFPAALGAAGTDILSVRNPVPMLLATGTVTAYNPVTAASSACRDETAGADGGAATASNQSALGFLLSCAGNAVTTAGNVLGVHFLVDRGL